MIELTQSKEDLMISAENCQACSLMLNKKKETIVNQNRTIENEKMKNNISSEVILDYKRKENISSEILKDYKKKENISSGIILDYKTKENISSEIILDFKKKELEANEQLLNYKAYEGMSIELILDMEKEINQLKNALGKCNCTRFHANISSVVNKISSGIVNITSGVNIDKLRMINTNVMRSNISGVIVG